MRFLSSSVFVLALSLANGLYAQAGALSRPGQPISIDRDGFLCGTFDVTAQNIDEMECREIEDDFFLFEKAEITWHKNGNWQNAWLWSSSRPFRNEDDCYVRLIERKQELIAIQYRSNPGSNMGRNH